jgi:hypothetical protein
VQTTKPVGDKVTRWEVKEMKRWREEEMKRWRDEGMKWWSDEEEWEDKEV